jgi:hypothetical protein
VTRVFFALVALLAQDPEVPLPRAPTFAYRDAYSLEYGFSHRGEAKLDVSDAELPIGEKFTIELRFVCNGGSNWFYNPFFSGLAPYPAAIIVYDAEKNYVGDYLYLIGGSRTRPSSRDWIYVLGSNGTIGAEFQRIAGRVPGTRSASRATPLPPGTYYLQAVYFNAFIGLNRESNTLYAPERTDELMRHFDTNELFRSNVVEIKLLPPAEGDGVD